MKALLYPCRGIIYPDQMYWRRYDATSIDDYEFAVGKVASYWVDGVELPNGGPADNDPVMLRSVT